MTIPSVFHSAAEVVTARPTVLGSKMAHQTEPTSNFDIIDIRHDAVENNLKDEILSSLRPTSGPKTLPTLLLYDERGLQLFEEVHSAYQKRGNEIVTDKDQITYLQEYFLTNAEIEVLEQFAGSIAEVLPAGAMVIELGSGFVTASGKPSRSRN